MGARRFVGGVVGGGGSVSGGRGADVEGELGRRRRQVGQQDARLDVEHVHLEMLRDAAVVALAAVDLERRRGLVGDGAVVGRIGNAGRVQVEQTRLALHAQRVGGPAQQRPEVEFGARRVAQHRDGSVGRRTEAGDDVDQIARAVEGPAEGRCARFRVDVALDFAGKALGSAVRAFLLRLAHRFICIFTNRSLLSIIIIIDN